LSQAKKARAATHEPKAMQVNTQEDSADEEDLRVSLIRVEFQVASQHPALVLKLDHNCRKVHFVIPALSLRKQEHEFGFKWFCQESDKHKAFWTVPNFNRDAMAPLPGNEELAEKFNSRLFTLIHIQIDEDVQPHWDGLPYHTINELRRKLRESPGQCKILTFAGFGARWLRRHVSMQVLHHR
jgi:hypothetical protein